MMSGNQVSSLWDRMKSSFWFIPGLLTVGGFLLSLLTQPLDSLIQPLLDQLPAIISGGAEGAGDVLSAIAGSLITVIATVFSLTIVIFTLTSGQYSPRMLRTLTSDRGLQVVLGFYIGTFVYSLMVLRLVTVSAGTEAGFHPVVSVAVAIILALVCVALFIYFVAHVTQLIQSSSIVKIAHDNMAQSVAKLDDLDEAQEKIKDPEENPRWEGLFAETPSIVQASSSGYVQDLNIDSLLAAVVDERTEVVDVPPGPGRFVSAGLFIVKVWPPSEGGLSHDAETKVNRAFVLGTERSLERDLGFGLRLLSDIALKGLSPGINDPTTTMQALDRIESVFFALGSKALPQRVQRRTVNGREVLVRIGHPTFDDLVGLAFDQVRRAAFSGGQVAVLERLLEILDGAIQANGIPERQRALWDRAFSVARLAPGQIPDPQDAANLMLRTVEMVPGLSLKERVAMDGDLDRLMSLSEDLEGEAKVREAVEACRRQVGPGSGRAAGSPS